MSTIDYDTPSTHLSCHPVRPRRRPDIREFVVEDEVILVGPPRPTNDPDQAVNNRAVTLNRSGRAIWELCDGGHTIDHMICILGERFQVDREILSRQVRDTLTRMSKMGFMDSIEGRSATGAGDTSSISRKPPGNGSMHETLKHLVERQSKDPDKVPLLGLGFVKTTLDPRLHERLIEHLRSNVRNFKSEDANDFLSTENSRSPPSLLYHDEEFNQRLMSDLHSAHEEWSGLSLKNAACYGIRVYQPRSFLLNHVDRTLTHVVSSTICIDHRLHGPWPLYIEDLEGQPHEVSIEPGEMVFYEGARLKHGRPYPLDGEYYANIFVHYTPVGWDLGSLPDQGPS